METASPHQTSFVFISSGYHFRYAGAKGFITPIASLLIMRSGINHKLRIMAPINIVIISSAVIVGAAVFLLRYHFFG
jgi:hypothetical protein